MKISLISLFIVLITTFPCAGEDAREIARAMLDRDDGTTEIGRVTLSTCSIGKKGKKLVCTGAPRVKVMDLIRKDYGPREKDHKTVTIILEPAAERGIGFLQYDYEKKGKETDQWLYLSALGKVKRIVSGNENEPKTGSFFGSELSYEDMEKRQIDDFTYTFLGRETYAKRNCAVIQAIPTRERAPKTNYSKVIYWVDTDRDMALKTILYSRQGKKFKQIYYTRITRIDNILVPMKIIVFNLESMRRTDMSYERATFNRPVQDEFLTQRTLTDGAFREMNLKTYQAGF